MPSIQLKFSDFVRTKLNDKNLSYRKVAERSGGLITHSTVGDIINEKVVTISVDWIVALAKGIGITEQELFDVARGKSPDVGGIADERFQAIARGYAVISEANRSNLEPLISVLEQTIQNALPETQPKPNRLIEKYFVDDDEDEDFLEEIKKPPRRKAS